MALTKVKSGGVKDDSIKNIDIKSDAAVEASKLDNPCQFADGHIVSFGTTGTGDLELYHSGSHGIFKNYTGNLYVYAKGTGNETGMVIVPDGEVQLMHDNTKTFETRSDGITLTGANNSYAVIEFNADNGDDNADKWLQYAGSDGAMYWQNYSSGSWANKLSITSAGNVGIGTDNPFEPTNYTGLELNGATGGCITFSDDDAQKWEIYGDASEIGFYDRGNTRYVFKVKNDQNIEISDGNLVIANGHGIDFAAQTATSATGATTGDEILDHYEEGTWTPVLKGGSSNPSGYSLTQNASTYTRVGRLVTAVTYIAWDGNGSGASGSAKIGGLPFSVINSQSYGGAAIGFAKLPANILSTTSCIAGYPHSGTDNLHMYRIPAATTAAEEGGAMESATWFNSYAGYISFTMTYETS